MRFTLVPAICLPLLLAGCATTPTFAPSTPSAIRGASISGVVHGGQQPIVGAEIFLFAANTTGYGGNGLAAGTGNASISLLQPAANTVQDTTSTNPTYLDYYTTTASDGSFSITGDYSCIPGQQVYIYALGGNPTYPNGSANSAIGLLAALGACPSGDSFPSNTYVVVNEVSTVAAAYAFAGFATDALHVSSSGTTAANLGIANAFVNAAMLETLSTGAANSTPPTLTTGAGTGIVPQAEINTLGNILAACVNSTGTVTGPTNPTACYTLFNNAMSGGTTGTQPTDTATAAINIAHNPVAAVSALYGLSSANAEFNPTLTAQPNDFTLSILFKAYQQGGPLAIDAAGDLWIASNSIFKLNGQGHDATGKTAYNQNVCCAYRVAIDANGNAWTTNPNLAVGEISNSGTPLSPIGGYTAGLPALSTASSIAVDASGNAWITAPNSGSVVKLSSSGTLVGEFTGSGLYLPGPVAIDPSGNAWIAGNTIVELSPTGSPLSGTAGYFTSSGATGIAIDHSGNVWLASTGSSSGVVTEISKTGAAIGNYSNLYLGSPSDIAIDGADNAWVVGVVNAFGIGSVVSEISSAGTFLSGSTGFQTTLQLIPGLPTNYYYYQATPGIAIDGSGDVWVNFEPCVVGFTCSFYTQELVGAAAPVVTPLALGVKNNTLGTRP